MLFDTLNRLAFAHESGRQTEGRTELPLAIARSNDAH